MPRRNDLGAFYRDVHRALSYSPPDNTPHTSDVFSGMRATGQPYWYWSCTCGVGRVYDELEAAMPERERHCSTHGVAENDNKREKP